MSAALREQFANDAVTTLNGAIDASQTSITVTSGAVFPSTGNFRIKIEDEILIVTARSSNTLTVVRGQEGTSGASHADASTTLSPVTAGSLLQWGQDNEAGFGATSAPPLSRLVDTDGTTILTSSDFSWVNQGTSVISDQNGTMNLRIPPATGENVRAQVRSTPSTPWSVIAAFTYAVRKENIPNGGICTRESGTGKMCLFSVNADGTSGSFRPAAYNMTNATTFSGTILGRSCCAFLGKHVWMKLQDNGTNVIWSMGFDGIEWVQMVSVGRTAHMAGGPNQVGFYLNHFNGNAHDGCIRLHHWSYGT